MPQYTIEMLWTCSGCGESTNKGLTRRCHNCGKPKGPEDAERFPNDISQNAALTGDADRAARAGPDWKCAYCGTLQPKLGRCCTNCGIDQTSGTEPWKHRTQRLAADAQGRTPIDTPTTQKPPRSSPPPRVTPLPAPSQWAEEPPRPAPSLHFSIPWRVVVLASGGVAFALFLWGLFAPRIVEAEVVSVHWEHLSLIHI